jgi:hypothetical protein
MTSSTFLQDFHHVATIGATANHGVDRQAATPDDARTRDWFGQWIHGAGWQLQVDGIGNMFGLLEWTPGAPFILIGSHLDSQPLGGRFDGAYGVVAALHAAHAIDLEVTATGSAPRFNLAVVNWFNEEGGRFAPSVMGSSVFTGLFDLEQMLSVRDLQGVSVRDALHGIGYLGTDAGPEAAGYAEIHIEQGRRSAPSTSTQTTGALYRNSLQLLGRDQALLSIDGRTVSLSARHSEILAILGNHSSGLSADDLCAQLYPGDGSAVTLRAEMVRLRKVLHGLSPDAVPESRPYRLPVELLPDSGQVLSCLQRGAHRIALEIYKGAVLPRSEAPGVVQLRERVSHLLREALLSDGSVDSLLKYAELPEAKYDVDLRLAVLKLLPPRSPKRAAVVADLERIDTELSA